MFGIALICSNFSSCFQRYAPARVFPAWDLNIFSLDKILLVIRSLRPGAGAETNHKPKSWYFQIYICYYSHSKTQKLKQNKMSQKVKKHPFFLTKMLLESIVIYYQNSDTIANCGNARLLSCATTDISGQFLCRIKRNRLKMGGTV